MGWLSMRRDGMGRHSTAKAYLDAQFTYTNDADGGGTRGARVMAPVHYQDTDSR